MGFVHAERERPSAKPGGRDVAPVAVPVRRVPPRVQAKLVVGGVDDPAEREADALADEVVAALRAGDGGTAGWTSPLGTATPGRIARRADPLGPAGGDLDPGTARELDLARAGGRPLEPRIRRSMEGAFGADFSDVRVHVGERTDQVAERIQARAFTLGPDVFVRRSDYNPNSTGGQHLLAHELAHTLQQGGATARRSVVRRQHTAMDVVDNATITTGAQERLQALNLQPGSLLDPKTFKAATATRGHRRGDALKAIDQYLVAYQPLAATTRGLTQTEREDRWTRRRNLLLQMRFAAEQWILAHSVHDDADARTHKRGETATNEFVVDPKRKKRYAGMAAFLKDVNAQIVRTEHALNTAAPATVPQGAETERHKKLTAKYDGDPTSVFTKVGTLIDLAVPNAGDASNLEVAFRFPVEPSGIAFLGGTIRAKAENDSPPGSSTGVQSAKNILARVELLFTGGAQFLDLAKLQAEFGGYLESSAPSGKECMTLMSYGIFRRFRESSVVPRGITNYLWGGGRKGRFGAIKAEQWSKDVEKASFVREETDPNSGAKQLVDTGAYVDMGMIGGVSASAGVKYGENVTGQTSGGITLSRGNRYDRESIESVKGTRNAAGAVNLGSGVGKKNEKSASADRSSAQKVLGKRSVGLTLAVDGSIGPFSGSADMRFQWLTPEGRGVSGANALQLAACELRFAAGASVPSVGGDELGQRIAGWATEGVQTLVSKVRAGVEGNQDRMNTALTGSEKKYRNATSGVGESLKSVFDGLDQLRNVGVVQNAVNPAAQSAGWLDGAKGATGAGDWASQHATNMQSAAPHTLGSSIKLTVALGMDLLERNYQLSFSFDKEIAFAIPMFLDVKQSRSTRIVAFAFSGGKWTVK